MKLSPSPEPLSSPNSTLCSPSFPRAAATGFRGLHHIAATQGGCIAGLGSIVSGFMWHTEPAPAWSYRWWFNQKSGRNATSWGWVVDPSHDFYHGFHKNIQTVVVTFAGFLVAINRIAWSLIPLILLGDWDVRISTYFALSDVWNLRPQGIGTWMGWDGWIFQVVMGFVMAYLNYITDLIKNGTKNSM